MEKTTTTSTI